MFWFHPAIWWLVSRVQLARETVVDELSILATNARRTYLDTLLAFADDTGLASSPAFSARRHLFHRVMLLSKEGEMSSIRVALGSCVLVLALGAGTVESRKGVPALGEPSEPQAIAAATARSADAPRHRSPPTCARVAVLGKRRTVDLTLTRRAESCDLILKGIAAEDRALDDQAGLRARARLQEHLPAHAGEHRSTIRDATTRRQDGCAQAAGRSWRSPPTRVARRRPRRRPGGVERRPGRRCRRARRHHRARPGSSRRWSIS